MSFGYSIGDFIAGANLSYQLIQALSGTRGASAEYQDALMELGCMQQTFLQVGRMTSNPNFSPATINAASHLVLSSMGLIGDFLAKTKRYRERLCGNGPGNAVSDSWQKMGWVLFKKEELKALRDTLHVRLSDISVLLATAKFQERMPSKVAQYHETSIPNPSPPPSYTHLVEDLPDLSPENLASDTVTPPILSVSSEDTKALELEAKFARLEKMMTQQKADQALFDQQRKQEPADMRGDCEVPFLELSDDVDKNPVDSEAIEPEPSFTGDPEKEIGLFTQFELFLKTQRRKEVHDSELISDLQRILDKHTPKNPKNKTMKPIKFKDAVGRKFTFPFHLAQTWAGMEELIKQAFLHVDVIGPHVAEGHYDLIGPNGEIILPQVWETMIEPDWAITMHMWPMPEPKPMLRPGPGGIPPPPPPPHPPPPLAKGWPGGPPTIVTRHKSPSWMSKANRIFKSSFRSGPSDTKSVYSNSVYSFSD